MTSATLGCGSSATTAVAAIAPSETRCQPSLTPSSASFGADGGTGTVTVGVARECSWTATSQAAWIRITSGGTGQGDGSVAFQVSANADPVSRNASMAVADQSTPITQGAAPCRFDVSGPADAIPAAGGQTSITVGTPDACSWTVASNASWVSVNPSAGHGTAQIAVIAGLNPGPDRTVILTVAQQQVVIRQVSPPVNVPAPAPAPVPTPPPPPAPAPTPPAPQPEPVDFGGEVDSLVGLCPDVLFAVKDLLVLATASTNYQKGNCKDLRNGQKVSGNGLTTVIAGASYVVAQTIQIKK